MQRKDSIPPIPAKIDIMSQEQKRILAVDYGAKRVGIAITDPLRMFAYPLITLENDTKFWEKFDKLFSEYEIEVIVLGYPLKEDGSKSSSTLLVDNFKKELLSRKSIEIVLVDERYSSSLAKKRILESVSSKKKRRNKSLIDMNAASIILQDYLEQN